jgi:hypothetical protein
MLWQIPEKNNLREERFILAYSIRGLSPWWASSMAFGLKWDRAYGREGWYLIATRKQSETERGGCWGRDISFMPQWPTSSNQAPPSTVSIPIHSSFNYESINGLIHRLGQSPHDPITFQKPTFEHYIWDKVFNTWAFGEHCLFKLQHLTFQKILLPVQQVFVKNLLSTNTCDRHLSFLISLLRICPLK